MTGSPFRSALLLVFAVLAASVAAATRVQAADSEAIPSHPALTSRFALELGGYYSRSNTQASLGPSSGGTGVIVDFEKTLGLEDRSTTPVGGFVWRMSERWRLEADYFSLKRDATRTLAADVTWGDQAFPGGASVSTRFDFTDTRVSAGYSFYKRLDKELGAGIGVHVAGVKSSLRSSNSGASESADVLAPLPVLNLYGAFALTNEWVLRLRVDWLSLNYDVYHGDLRNTNIDLLYQAFRNVGFGLGLRTFVLDVEIDDPKWRGRARTVFSGPTAFMSLSF